MGVKLIAHEKKIKQRVKFGEIIQKE